MTATPPAFPQARIGTEDRQAADARPGALAPPGHGIGTAPIHGRSWFRRAQDNAMTYIEPTFLSHSTLVAADSSPDPSAQQSAAKRHCCSRRCRGSGCRGDRGQKLEQKRESRSTSRLTLSSNSEKKCSRLRSLEVTDGCHCLRLSSVGQQAGCPLQVLL